VQILWAQVESQPRPALPHAHEGDPGQPILAEEPEHRHRLDARLAWAPVPGEPRLFLEGLPQAYVREDAALFIPVDSAENDHSRRTWYEKVGSAPMVIIAREFSISDRGLAMRCRDLRAAVDLT